MSEHRFEGHKVYDPDGRELATLDRPVKDMMVRPDAVLVLDASDAVWVIDRLGTLMPAGIYNQIIAPEETIEERAARLGVEVPTVIHSPSRPRTQRCGRCKTPGLIWQSTGPYYVVAATHEVHSCGGGSLRYVTNAYKQPTWKRGRLKRR